MLYDIPSFFYSDSLLHKLCKKTPAIWMSHFNTKLVFAKNIFKTLLNFLRWHGINMLTLTRWKRINVQLNIYSSSKKSEHFGKRDTIWDTENGKKVCSEWKPIRVWFKCIRRRSTQINYIMNKLTSCRSLDLLNKYTELHFDKQTLKTNSRLQVFSALNITNYTDSKNLPVCVGDRFRGILLL